ncbi:MAG: hypothetical protein E3J71_04930 [Candidatus Stahlbacteria bacterium]|nr:MAG: hypothetical protein E3J71_04930 [Candidatus Stahlbacteria bacterium]
MLGVLMFLLVQTQADTVYNLRDFRLPDAGAMKLEMDAGLDISGRDDYETWSAPDEEYIGDQTGGSGGGYWGFDWEFCLRGENRYIYLKLNPLVRLGISSYRYVSQEDTVEYERQESYFHQSANLRSSAYANWYIGESPFFWGIDGHFFMDESGYWHEDTFYNPGIWTSGAIYAVTGVGRIRDATPAAHAWQFLEEIDQLGYDNINSLAELLSVRWRYEMKHWRYERFFYQDVENRLLEEGIVKDLSAYELMRLREIISYFPQDRLSGTRLKLGVGGYPWVLETWANLKGAYPLSRRLQFSFLGVVELAFPELEEVDHSLYGNSTLAYYVGERLKIFSAVNGDWRTGVFNYLLGEGERVFLSFTPFGLDLYLDEKLKLSTKVTYYFDRTEEQYAGVQSLDVRHSVSLRADLTWRLR